MRNAMIGLLILAYLSTLAMSAGHLAQWYAKSLGGLPPGLAWGLAGSLEFTAFLLSLLSNSLLRGSSWAGTGAVLALGLVWVGNALSMHRGAPDLPLWEVLLMSLFVPVGTYVVGKVVGELLAWPHPVAVMATRERRTATQSGHLASSLAGEAATNRENVAAPGQGAGREVATQRAHLAPGVLKDNGEDGALWPGVGHEGGREGTATLKVKRSVDMEWTLEGRAVEVVRALSAHGGPVAVARLAAELGWPRTTLRRYLDRLEGEGVVVRTEEGWALAREVDHV